LAILLGKLLAIFFMTIGWLTLLWNQILEPKQQLCHHFCDQFSAIVYSNIGLLAYIFIRMRAFATSLAPVLPPRTAIARYCKIDILLYLLSKKNWNIKKEVPHCNNIIATYLIISSSISFFCYMAC